VLKRKFSKNKKLLIGRGKFMRHHLSPGIESLESKNLLSHTAVGLISRAIPRLAVAIAVPASSLAVSLTTDAATYTPGQTVRMTFTETNDTGHNVFVGIGPSIDGFTITRAGGRVWRSNSGFTPEYIVSETLAPGASITLTADWTASSVTGTYSVFNQLDPGASTAFQIVASSAVAVHPRRA
jgi:hypothetical protein